MAEVTVDRGPTVHNYGDQQAISARVDIANSGDVWTHGLRDVQAIIVPPTTNLTSVALSADGSTVVFTTGAAVNDLLVTVVGYP